MKQHRLSHQKGRVCRRGGVALVEVLVASAIIASAFVAIIGIYSSLSVFSVRALPRIQAAMLAEEGIEALRSMRDGGFDSHIGNLSISTSYHLHWSTASSSYSATSTVQSVDGTFYRTFTLSNVYRDGSYNIAPSGTLDADARLVTMNVSWWDRTATSTYTLQSYLSNAFNN